MKRIAHQGIEGSYSDLLAKSLFSNDSLQGYATFQKAFEAVEQEEADFALLPIENTLAGTIYETIDLLVKGDLKIAAVSQIRVEHSLLALRGARLEDLQKVLSHPKALAQCTRFFADHPALEAVPYYDTAGAAADVAKKKELTLGAIAHKGAAAIYGLEILSEAIQDHAENFTRFFLISKKGGNGDRYSLCFTLQHQIGALAEILSFFAEKGINLTYIVSRPLIGSPYEYLFYVDLQAPNSSFLEELGAKTSSYKLLGNYSLTLS